MEYRKKIESTEELADWYNKQYESMGDGWVTPASEITQHLDDLGVPFDTNKTLLDVGCGAGHFLLEAQKRVRVVGLEISGQAIQYCRNRGVATVCRMSIEQPHDDIPQFDYIVSMGSLEHVVDLDKALINIRKLLKPDGKFYFLCPNETWKHFDQPNERTMTDSEWIILFGKHGLFVKTRKQWNDSTAFIGDVNPEGLSRFNSLPPNGNKLNIGSGQRRFDNAHGWINVDCVSRPGQIPDLICDVGKEKLPYPDNSMDCVVLHQVYEHFGLGEGHGLITEAHRVLRDGGSLIITIPDMRALAQRWLTGQISDYIYFVNMYGAYQGEDGDRHKWGYTYESIRADFQSIPAIWSDFKPYNWRSIPGADIARDWWTLGIEAIK